jgi:hypothetical protein
LKSFWNRSLMPFSRRARAADVCFDSLSSLGGFSGGGAGGGGPRRTREPVVGTVVWRAAGRPADRFPEDFGDRPEVFEGDLRPAAWPEAGDLAEADAFLLFTEAPDPLPCSRDRLCDFVPAFFRAKALDIQSPLA